MEIDLIALGRRIRFARKEAGLTLSTLSARVGVSLSHLSLIETGQRESGIALLGKIAHSLGVTIESFTNERKLDRRTELTIALEHAQRSETYLALNLPRIRISANMGIELLENLVGLYDELNRRSEISATTPEEARRANARLRIAMKSRNNYYPELEQAAHQLLTSIDYLGGPLSGHQIELITSQVGFTLARVRNLPHSTRSLTDLKNNIIYIPESGWGGHDPRTVILQTVGHQVLGHQTPKNFSDFLEQRIQVNYFAAALLAPEKFATPILKDAKAAKEISIEDLRDSFSLSYETAAHRFTNLATQHLDLKVDFVKVHESGTIYKAYENDGFSFATDPAGSIEGQLACRHSGARQIFQRKGMDQSYYQYLDTPQGTFWSTTQSENTASGAFSLSVGVPFDKAKWFRGSQTKERARSTCPSASCCAAAPHSLSDRWAGLAWPSARAHSHLLATLPPGSFPGVDDTAVYEFLESMEPSASGN